ncbi:MAG: EAL domain-containing protein [Gammaproteobacteria bacterium]
MAEHQADPIIVISSRPDDAEAIKQALRNAGSMAQCHGMTDTKELVIAMQELNPVLLVIFASDFAAERFTLSVQARDTHQPDLPVVAVQPRVSEESIAAAMAAGANDLVSLGNQSRLQAVAMREIVRCRQARDLREMQDSAEQLERQVEALVKDSQDALLHVQEGIITDANPAWLEMLGYQPDAAMLGTPALDVFDENDHLTVKGALSACMLGNWKGHTLELKMKRESGDYVATQIELERGVFDDEPCVRMCVEIDVARTEARPKQIVDGSAHHPLTGFYRRQRFLTVIEEQLAMPSKGGLRVLAYVKPDNIHKVREQIGPISSDDLLLDFAKILQEHVRKDDLYGQFGGDLFMILTPRGTMRDAIAWAENLNEAINAKLFEVEEKSISVSCTIGLAQHMSTDEDVADLVLRAQKAYQMGTKSGGNTVSAPNPEDSDAAKKLGDTSQVQQIKNALMRDNFRLVYQPVASLNDQSEHIFDALLRMIDEDGREIMPNAFLPAAARHGMMKSIDRWVIASAIRFCKQQKKCRIFVRLSVNSILDETLFEWIKQQVTGSGVEPSLLVFQVTENDSENNLKPVKELATSLSGINCCFAIEHFGLGSHPLQLLEHIPVDFVKIDGSLMEGITTDKKLQQKVKNFVSGAIAKNINTVAERVEDANTMAVLWQIGLQYIQGFYVQGPEEIVIEG